MALALELSCYGQKLWILIGGSPLVGLGKDNGLVASLNLRQINKCHNNLA